MGVAPKFYGDPKDAPWKRWATSNIETLESAVKRMEGNNETSQRQINATLAKVGTQIGQLNHAIEVYNDTNIFTTSTPRLNPQLASSTTIETKVKPPAWATSVVVSLSLSMVYSDAGFTSPFQIIPTVAGGTTNSTNVRPEQNTTAFFSAKFKLAGRVGIDGTLSYGFKYTKQNVTGASANLMSSVTMLAFYSAD